MENFDEGVVYRPGVNPGQPMPNMPYQQPVHPHMAAPMAAPQMAVPPVSQPIQQPSRNPLAAYFRVPGVHVKLPTNGVFLPPGTYFPTAAGDIPVLPMRAADEMLLQAPDALMSGYAIEEMLKSCVPAIKSPRDISVPDLYVLYLAIRVATVGETIEIEAKCPKCQHENLFDAHLPMIMQTVKEVPAENPVRFSDEVVAMVRPHNFGNMTKMALSAFNMTRRLQALQDNPMTTDEEKTAAYNEGYRVMSELHAEIAADCIIEVIIPEGRVTDREQIREFVANMSRAWYEKLESKIAELNDLGIDRNVSVECQKCSHSWNTEIEFDPANFFAPGS